MAHLWPSNFGNSNIFPIDVYFPSNLAKNRLVELSAAPPNKLNLVSELTNSGEPTKASYFLMMHWFSLIIGAKFWQTLKYWIWVTIDNY